MTFSRETWQTAAHQKLQETSQWLTRHRQGNMPFLIYGTVAGLTLWPLVETAVRTGSVASVIGTIYAVTAGIGTNLVANQIEAWKNQAQPPTETEVSQWVVDQAPANPDLGKTIDDILQALQALTTAQEALPAAYQADFHAQLRQELEQLGNLTYFQATLTGSGAVVQGEGAQGVGERGVLSGGAVGGDIVTGDNNHIEHIIHIYQAGGGQLSATRLKRAIVDYAEWVVTHYGRLPLRGLSDKEYYLPHPDLPDIYVSLVAQSGFGRGERGSQIDMSTLLNQGPRLVITGGPGSGKTTFLRHIAYLLAHAIHTGEDAGVRQLLNLKGAIPLPIYLSLADYHRYRQTHTEGTLIDFISHTLIQQHGVYGLPPDFFAQMLSQDNTICLLLDSLDEIPTDEGRFQVSNAVLQLADNRSIGQMLIASRDHAYVGRTMLPQPFQRFIVQPMEPKQIEALVNRWCTAVYPPHEANAQAQDLVREITILEDIRKQQREAPLVDTPLMVTIVAIVHYNDRKLPQQRAALYDKCVTALLAEQHKGEEGQGESQAALEKRGGSTDAKRGYLSLLAFEMMRRRTDQNGGRTISQDQITEWLLPEFQQNEGSEAAPQKLAEFHRAMFDRASILHERAGEIEFTHLTFQEFLCAHYLAVIKSPEEAAAFFQEENRVTYSWWRETILLTIGYLAKTATPKSLKLVQAMLDTYPDDDLGLSAAEVAASGLLEMEVPAPDTRRNTRDRLLALLTDSQQRSPVAMRALAGRTLSSLGDKRAGVGIIERDGVKLPDILWSAEIPAGSYTIGDNESTYDDEKPRDVVIDNPYQVARYPITTMQFQCFIDAPDRDDARWWQGLPDNEQKFSEPEFPDANHPRERVSWYQAVAFCRWLTAKLQTGEVQADGLVGDLSQVEIGLPHEFEWEVAARWPNEGVQARIYPWGAEFDEAKANTSVGDRIGQTTAVGLYPSGKNETLDLYDMSGNVWEWCRNKYNEPEETAVDQSNDPRVLRGGSWYFGQNNARAASRSYNYPGDRGNSVGFRVAVRRPPSHVH